MSAFSAPVTKTEKEYADRKDITLIIFKIISES